MKKLLAGIITLLIILTTITPGGAFASTRREQKIKLSDAIDMAKTQLDIKTENYNFNYNYNENQTGNSTWDLSWNSKKSSGGGIYASVDSETGDITSFNSWDPSMGQITTKIPKYSKDKAYEEVLKFVKKVAPSKFSQTVLSDSANTRYYMPINSDTYNYNFTRKVNGVDFPENGITVSIDKNTLKVRNYNLTWDNASFPDPSKAIGLDAAKKAFSTKSGIELSYNIITDYNSKTKTPILVYTLKDGSTSIDAITGELINNDHRIIFNDSMKSTANAGAAPAKTPEEQKSIDDSSKYVSKEKALEEAKKYLTIDDDTKLNNSSLYVNDFDHSASWSFYWNKNNTAKQISSGMSAEVDAVTGKIKSFSMYGNEFYPEKETPVSVTTEQALDIAQKFISGLEPDKFKTTVKVNNTNTDPSSKITDYNFSFTANINGAKCSFDSFNISVNAFTGKVMSYNMNWNDIALPASDKAISLEDAYKALYNKAKLNLKYIKVYNYNAGKYGNYDIKLAYVLDDFSGMMDANNGTFLDGNGKPVVEKKEVKYSDIKGNAAENDINILTDLGIIDDNSSTFRPDAQILQKDFIKMLVKSFGDSYIPYDATAKDDNNAYDSYYDTAIQRKIITESQKQPDAAVTKLDAAKMIIRAMGLGYVGEINNLYKLSFKDASLIPTSYTGYAALASSLNILVPANGNFNGLEKLTRGQTATAIVNYLKVDTSK